MATSLFCFLCCLIYQRISPYTTKNTYIVTKISSPGFSCLPVLLPTCVSSWPPSMLHDLQRNFHVGITTTVKQMRCLPLCIDSTAPFDLCLPYLWALFCCLNDPARCFWSPMMETTWCGRIHTRMYSISIR